MNSESTVGHRGRAAQLRGQSECHDLQLGSDRRPQTTCTDPFGSADPIGSALKGVVTKNGKTYEKMYRSEKEERVMVVPTAETNEKWINNALSAVLQEMADDSGLLMFLTK